MPAEALAKAGSPGEEAMRAAVKMLSLLVGLAVAAVIVYRTTHPSPPSVADINAALATCDQDPKDPSCPRTDFTFAPSK